MEKTGAEVLLGILEEHGVEICWGYPGGAILPLYDVLFKKSSIRHILVRHEQAAAFAAEGYARSTGKLGVCIATSGPGATNLVTGIADAKMDSVPILAITGQVPTKAIGTDAFQETDIYGMSIPITKYNALIKNVDDVARITEEAIQVALSGRPGPVLIDFPKDIQVEVTSITKAEKLEVPRRHLEKPPIQGDIDRLIWALERSQRPLLYIGGGAIHADASREIIALAEKIQAPVVTSLMGIGAFPGDHPYSLGMLGMHGTAYANKAVMECDFILGIGARFDDRVAGVAEDFARNAIKAHIDIDPAEISKRVVVDIPIVGDVKEVLEILISRLKPVVKRDWIEYIKKLKEKYPLRFGRNSYEIKPQEFIYRLYEKTKEEDPIITTDVGQHQMWVAQFYMFSQPRRFLTSGGLGSMGFGFPAAIGAQLAYPEKLVICISGDGSFQMNMQELGTCVMYKIPVKVVVINNGFLGMVRQWQELFYEERFSHSQHDYNPDFARIAEAYDIPGMRITHPSEIDKGIEFLLKDREMPALLEVVIPEEEKVFPMIAAGKKYSEMIEFTPSSQDEEIVEVIPNAKEPTFKKISKEAFLSTLV